MGAVEQRPVEGTTLSLRVPYRRVEELLADDLRWFSAGRLPPVPPEVVRLELRLEVEGGPSIIATAEQKLWRFDVASGARMPIPFRAHVEQTATEALRTPRRIGWSPAPSAASQRVLSTRFLP